MFATLERTWLATPDPKWVVAVGDCGADGGVFAGSPAIVGGVSAVVPVDMVIPGCPPSPTKLLAGLLSLFADQAATSTATTSTARSAAIETSVSSPIATPSRAFATIPFTVTDPFTGTR